MKDLEKVNSAQLFGFWKSLSIGLLVLIVTVVVSRLLPFYCSPIVALIAAAFLYTVLYNGKYHSSMSCMVVPYAFFYCLIAYSFLSIFMNVLYIWDVIRLPKELSFFNEPFIPALILNPVCFVVLLVIYLRNNTLSICIDCRVERGLSIERGKLGNILHTESRLQLRNLVILFGVLTLVTSVYYFRYYVDVNLNGRDWYVFLWINVFAFLGMEIYSAARYYNMYLDLKDAGEIITEDELSDMTVKTYLRYYVICANDVYLNMKIADARLEDTVVVDTPFVTKRNVNGISTAEVDAIIRRMCGGLEGRLRFFFGRKSPDLAKHRILRYFYFLPGKSTDYPDMNVDGEWVNFETIKIIYNEAPETLSRIFRSDISRMTTVILTQKLFDSRGYRKVKIRSYHPTYDLQEVQDRNYDFQDEKWIRIAMFNSDTRGFHVRRFFRKFFPRPANK